MSHKRGWKRSLPDFRDVKLGAPRRQAIHDLPPKVDLRDKVAEVYDQEDCNSCTSNSTTALIRICNVIQGYPDVPPSRLFHYFCERLLEGDLKSDDGAEIRTAMKVAAKFGICPEKDWPYDVKKLYDAPPSETFKSAVQNMVHIYFAMDQRLDDLKHCLATGFPFVFGFTVFSSFEDDKVMAKGMLPFPTKDDKSEGGHAVCCVGYDDSIKRFTILNSYGTDWGDKGYFYMPYTYMTDPDLCDDFWTVRLMEAPNDPTRAWNAPLII